MTVPTNAPRVTRRWLVDLAVMLAGLGLVNVAVAFWLDGWASAVLLVGSAAAAVVGARRRGYTDRELGLARGDAVAGLRLGGGVTVLIIAGVAVVASMPWTRGFFEDDRFDGLSTGEVLYEVAVRIPFVTALGEELLFRSVLLAVLLVATTAVRAVVMHSLAFGLWHVLTTIGDLDGNETTSDLSIVQQAFSVTGIVVVTGLAGAAFAWTRLRSGSVVAPWLVHTAFNASAFVAGAVLAM